MRGRKKRRNAGPRRWEWLTEMIRYNLYTIGAEVGVYNGVNAAKMLSGCPELNLFLVDRWKDIEPDPNGERIGCENWDAEKGYRQAMSRVQGYNKRITVLRGDSVKMADKVEDGSLDFVFIDADHRYAAVKADIQAWAPKVREGGVVCGHDFDYPSLEGVRKAVEECFVDFKETGIDYVWYAKREDYVD